MLKSLAATFLIIASIDASALQPQQFEYNFTATIQSVWSHDPEIGSTNPATQGITTRGTFESGQEVTGKVYFRIQPSDYPWSNASKTFVAYSAINYRTDGGFEYQDSSLSSPASQFISHSPSFIHIRSSRFYPDSLDMSKFSFSGATGTALSDINIPPIISLDNFESATLEHLWQGIPSPTAYSFQANITSITLVPELPIWALMLCGIGVVGASKRRLGAINE